MRHRLVPSPNEHEMNIKKDVFFFHWKAEKVTSDWIVKLGRLRLKPLARRLTEVFLTISVNLEDVLDSSFDIHHEVG